MKKPKWSDQYLNEDQFHQDMKIWSLSQTNVCEVKLIDTSETRTLTFERVLFPTKYIVKGKEFYVLAPNPDQPLFWYPLENFTKITLTPTDILEKISEKYSGVLIELQCVKLNQ